MSTATKSTITDAERLAFIASLPDVVRLGDWPHFLVIAECRRAADETEQKGGRVIFEGEALMAYRSRLCRPSRTHAEQPLRDGGAEEPSKGLRRPSHPDKFGRKPR
jgi:hypothetical protein